MTFILHTTGPVKIDTAVIGGVEGLGSNLGSQVKGEPSSGEVYARAMLLYGQKPTVQFSCRDIEAAMAACGPLGLSLATKNLTLYGSKLLAGGAIDATGHVSLACALGLLYPTTLSVAHQGDATIGYSAAIYNATDASDPFTLTTAATLPTAVAFKRWAFGSLTMGGVTITQNMNVSVNFGIKVATEGSDSNIRDSIAYITEIQPVITCTSSNQGNILSFLGVDGAFSLVLRDRLSGGTFGSSTITIAATKGLAMQDTPFQAQGHRPGEISLSGHIYWDGSTAPLTYTYDKGSESA